MAKLSAQEFIEAIKEMTVLELNDLVKACERWSWLYRFRGCSSY